MKLTGALTISGAIARMTLLLSLSVFLAAAPGIDSPDAARTEALRFLRAINVTLTDDRAHVQRSAPESRLGGDTWLVEFNRGERILVRASDGTVIDYFSPAASAATREIPAKRPLGQAEAQAAAEAILDATVPGGETFQIFAVRFQSPGTDPQFGFWVIEWVRSYQGVPFESDYARVMLEANSGTPFAFHMSLDTPLPVSVSFAVARTDAERIARGAVEKSSRDPGGLPTATLKILQPNQQWGSTAGSSDSRVAWVVEFPSASVVFVDASTGELLGGRQQRSLQPPSPGPNGSLRPGMSGSVSSPAPVPPPDPQLLTGTLPSAQVVSRLSTWGVLLASSVAGLGLLLFTIRLILRLRQKRGAA